MWQEGRGQCSARAQLLERCERMGLGGFATEPRDSLNKLLQELKDMKADFPTKAKQDNLTRALDVTRMVTQAFSKTRRRLVLDETALLSSDYNNKEYI